MQSAERLIVIGIVGGLHRHDEYVQLAWHIVVTFCVDVSGTMCMCNFVKIASHHGHDVSMRLPWCNVTYC